MYYQDYGEGSNIVFLHGWGVTGRTFDKVSRHFDNYHVWILDLPGFGLSPEPEVCTTDYYVSKLSDFIIENKISNPIIIGHSFGGRIAIKYASKYHVSKLILIDSGGIVEHGFMYHIKVMLYKTLKFFKIKNKMGSTDYKNASLQMKKVLVNATNESLIPYMKKINCETLIIFGKNDEITPVDHGKIMETNIKNSGLVVIPNSGHFPYIENPKYFLLVVDSFLSCDSK